MLNRSRQPEDPRVKMPKFMRQTVFASSKDISRAANPDEGSSRARNSLVDAEQLIERSPSPAVCFDSQDNFSRGRLAASALNANPANPTLSAPDIADSAHEGSQTGLSNST